MAVTRKMIGIDVSKWQGEIDFEKVKKSGIDFVMIKAGGSDGSRRYTDPNFYKNYNAATRAGLHVGAYYYMGKNSINHFEGRSDAIHFAQIIANLKFDMPVALDVEAQDIRHRTGTTNAIEWAGDYLEKLGYYVVIYGSRISTFVDRVDDSRLLRFDHWVADYRGYSYSTPHPYTIERCGLWQYTDRNKVFGISGNVDGNVAYKDYPAIIKNARLNGYKNEEVK